MKQLLLAGVTMAALLLPVAPALAENWEDLGKSEGVPCNRYFDADSIKWENNGDVRYVTKEQCSIPQHTDYYDYSSIVMGIYLNCGAKTYTLVNFGFYDTDGKQLDYWDIEQEEGLSKLEFKPIQAGSFLDIEYKKTCQKAMSQNVK